MTLSDHYLGGYTYTNEVDQRLCDVNVSQSGSLLIPPPIHLTKQLRRSRSRASKIERQRLALLKVERDDEIVNRALSVLTSSTSRLRRTCSNDVDTRMDINTDDTVNSREKATLAHRYKSLIERAFILGVCKGDTKRKGQQKRKESIAYYTELNGSFEGVEDHVEDKMERYCTHESSNETEGMGGTIDEITVQKTRSAGMESELQWIFQDDDEEHKSRAFMWHLEDTL